MLEKMKAEFEKWHRFPVTDDMDMQTEVAWMNWQAAWNAGISDATGWRDVVDELPNEAQEVLFVRNRKTVHGAWIGGIFWHNNEKCAAATWRPMPEPPSGNRIGAILPEVPTFTKSQTAIDDEKMRDITSVLIDGLNTDGSEHKQLALEQALEMLVPDEFAECKASWQWDSGR